MELNELSRVATGKKKRVGRGYGSGKGGHTTGKGAKGQKMRDLFEMAPNVAAYVQKPFDPKMLRELIAGVLAKSK